MTSTRKIHKSYIRTRDFNFSLQGLTGFDLYGKTVGVIGTGKIGRVFIDICNGFGMKVIAYDKYPSDIPGVEYKPLDTVYKEADIISFHCPLTDDTQHMFNFGTLGKIKPGVVIINTSRGALIDAEALLEGIKTKKIGAACLDVYEEESGYFYEDLSGSIIDDDTLSRLISMPNVIVTSHQAFLTREALENIATTTVDNISKITSGEECANIVS
jgi:D-lactate dehydrogenase